MPTMRKRTIAGLAAIGVLALGAGTAVAAGPGAGLGRHAGQAMGLGAGHGQGGMARHGGAGQGLRIGDAAVDAAGSYIGIDRAQLVEARHDGDSLATIATAHGKTVAGLRAAIVAALDARIDALVASHRLTAAQGTAMKARVAAQVDAMIGRTATGPSGMRLGLAAPAA